MGKGYNQRVHKKETPAHSEYKKYKLKLHSVIISDLSNCKDKTFCYPSVVETAGKQAPPDTTSQMHVTTDHILPLLGI